MKLITVLVAAVMMIPIGTAAKEYKYQTVKGDLMGTRVYTLDNGLKVYLSVNKEKPRIQANIAVKTGSRNDPAETTGLAHYLEHLMFKGTHTFGVSDPVKEAPYLQDIENRYEAYRKLIDPAQRKAAYHGIDSVSQIAARYFIPNEYDKLMASIGSEGSNAYTSFDVTCYEENIPNNEIDNWAKIQSNRFQDMVIRGFHTELEAVYEEYNIGLANDGEKEYDAMFGKLFPTHPYGTQTTIGTQEHLKNPSITNIKNYFHRYYVPNNIAICMAGDFNPDEVIATLDKYFGSWKPSATLSRPEFGLQPSLAAPVDTTVIGLEAPNIMMAWRGEAGNSAEADTLNLMGDILSNGSAGLYDVDLEQTMKCMGVGAGTYELHDYSALLVEAFPKEGQTLKEVRQLALDEIDKLKRGEFDDDLVPAIINNKKLRYYRSLQDNKNRVGKLVDAFINDVPWSQQAGRIDRQSHITKQQIVAFANRFFTNGFVTVYKEQGTDSTQKKIDKPAITAIPTNRDMSSKYLNDIHNSQVKPIEPRFLDFKKDLTVSTTKNKLPLLYKQNTDDGLFTLAYYFKFGEESSLPLSYASDYLDYIGTQNKTVSQIKKEFYKLACSYGISVSDNTTSIYVTGLQENMAKATRLLDQLITTCKGDTATWNKFVAIQIKARNDRKSDQQANYQCLRAYGMFGPYNSFRHVMSDSQLRSTSPDQMTAQLHHLFGLQHTILYYGPLSLTDFNKTFATCHQVAKNLKPVPAGKEYIEQTTPKNEILLAPYDAKNIYMTMFHNENRVWNPAEYAVERVLGEYFGGGMNTIVFQELRESRGLAYNAYALYRTPWRKNHYENFFTHIISQNDKMMDCIRVFRQILDSVPQSQSAFEIAKQSLMKTLQAQRVTRFDVLNSYLGAQQRGLDYDINRTTYEKLPSVTLQDIVKFEQQNMAKKPMKYLILGDEKNLDIKSLERIAPIRRVSTDEIFGY